MSVYNFVISNKAGVVQKGKVEAFDREEAVNLVKKDGFYIMDLKEKTSGMFGFLTGKKDKLTAFERINFTDHLASLIRAGTPLREALEAYIDEREQGSDMIARIIKDVEQGRSLSDSLSSYPHTFAPLYIALVKAGEMTGNLDETLEYLANELRREHEFKQRVKSAMFYPSLVLGVSVLVILLIVIVVFPKITEVMKNLGGDLPLTTRMLMSFADFTSSNLILIILGLIAGVVGIFTALKSKSINERLNARLLNAPVIGKVMKKYILARFLRVIGSCLKYGISLPMALDAAKGVVANSRYRATCDRLSTKIKKGFSLSEAIADEGVDLYPGIISRTVKGAEKTGGIDVAFARLSTQYEIEVDRDLKRVTELLEPILVVFLGIVVLFIAMSVIAPIYQVTSKIK